MTCSDVDRILPDIVDGVPIESSIDFEVLSHLKTCPACSELLADLKLIASEARSLSDSEEPPSRVWVRIAAELRAEGLIRDNAADYNRPVLVSPPRRWKALWLVPVAAMILAISTYELLPRFASHSSPQSAHQSQQQAAPQVAQQQSASSSTNSQPAHQEKSSPQVAEQGPKPIAPHTSRQPVAETPVEQAEVSAPPSSDDQRFLNEVSTRMPGMRMTYENQLQTVNNEIRETQAYINLHPGDIEARQHLLEVYQQKVMLYQMALDRIQ